MKPKIQVRVSICISHLVLSHQKPLHGTRGRQWNDNCLIVCCAHHLKLNLNAQRLLLDCRHACGEGLPHASCPSQGQLGNPFKASNGTGESIGSTRSAHEQGTDDLPARHIFFSHLMLFTMHLKHHQHPRNTSSAILTFGSPAGGWWHWMKQDSALRN